MVGNFDYGCPLCGEYVHEATADMESESSWVRFAAGHWTREPAEVEGLYLENYDMSPQMDLVYLKVGKRPPGQTSHRWSVPLPEMPPVPEGE